MSYPTSAIAVKSKKKEHKTGQIILNILILVFVLVCTLPFINVIAISLSSKSAILRGDVSFWPVEFSTRAYEVIINDPSMFHSLGYTVKITVIYTLLAMVMTILYAFPMTMKRLKGRKFFMFFIVFTMYFSGGTIPIYLNVKELGMINTQWSLIFPGLISTFNIIILKNFFEGLPYELNEAAYIDGANDFQILLKIYLPLSFSSIATLSLFYAVGKWNSFSDALYYINSRDLQPLQLKLYNLIKGGQAVEVSVQEGSSNDLASSISASIESATIIFATVPILVVYPFVQRYFVAGVTLGAVKG
ncbi:carbohydrate ABC transporter permease [Aristaeella lactis]|uniref:Aldouronate transport system permease protein n=1 Tax=Aristaeella lactis TaxID=3046383 RepID=A0AC61PJ29_9FIRM|nr:carbohydrate ABC transporter permease [Aristaeella lactis]QUA53980.1 carbohydrate ABC transporter permease [Aristaeella lactis]SMC41926.1 putative aldouronate transport system permease protein [Aristaeella lactis]